MLEPDIDVAAFAAAAAAAQSLPLPEAYRPGVEANLVVAFRLSKAFLEFELPDETEPAPVFDATEDSR